MFSFRLSAGDKKKFIFPSFCEETSVFRNISWRISLAAVSKSDFEGSKKAEIKSNDWDVVN